MPDVAPAYDLIDRGGVIATLLVVIAFLVVGLLRQWIVTGPHHKDTKESEAAWKLQAQESVKAITDLRDELREQRMERRGR